MATYIELYDLMQSDAALANRISVACFIAAEAIRVESPSTANHAERLVWMKSVFANPKAESQRMLAAVLAANKDATKAQIQAATDATIQTAVNAAVNAFAV